MAQSATEVACCRDRLRPKSLGVYDLARITDAVRGSDIIALQEVTRNFAQCPDASQPERIAELLPDYHWIYSPHLDLDASARDADGRVTNKRLQSGNMLLAHWPIFGGSFFCRGNALVTFPVIKWGRLRVSSIAQAGRYVCTPSISIA